MITISLRMDKKRLAALVLALALAGAGAVCAKQMLWQNVLPAESTVSARKVNTAAANEQQRRDFMAAYGWEVEEVDYDGRNATDLAIRMNEDRNREDFCVEVAQTCAGQNLAVKTFRELLLQEKVVLEESPLAYWCLGNAIEIQNNYGDLKLSKRHKDDTERIDPVAAAMNALARLLVKRSPGRDINEHVLSEDWGI